MTKAVIKSEIAADPDAIWQVIKDFAAIKEWNPLVKSVAVEGDGVGSVRTLDVEGAGKFVERLDQIDEGERIYTYSIVKCPLQIGNCVIKLRVKDNGDGTSTVEWSSEFEADPNQGLSAVQAFQKMHQDALNKLGMAFTSKQED